MTRNRILPIQGTSAQVEPAIATYMSEVTEMMAERAAARRAADSWFLNFRVVAAALLTANILAVALLPIAAAIFVAIPLFTVLAVFSQVIRLNAIQRVKNLNHAIRRSLQR